MKKTLLLTAFCALPVMASAQANTMAHETHTPSATSAQTGVINTASGAEGINNASVTVEIKAEVKKAVHVEHINEKLNFTFDKLFQDQQSNGSFKVFANCGYKIKVNTNNTLKNATDNTYMPYDLSLNGEKVLAGSKTATEITAEGPEQEHTVTNIGTAKTGPAGQNVDFGVRINNAVYKHGDYTGSFKITIEAAA